MFCADSCYLTSLELNIFVLNTNNIATAKVVACNDITYMGIQPMKPFLAAKCVAVFLASQIMCGAAFSATPALDEVSPRAQNTSGVEKLCTRNGPKGILNVAVCKPGLTTKQQATSAAAICEEQLACIVWLWDDAGKAPSAPPENSQDLTQEQINSAIGVWIHNSKKLITLSSD